MRAVLEIDNIYEDGVEIHTVAEVDIEPPPADETSKAYSDWEYDEIFPHTGTDTRSGDAGYFVEIAECDDPSLIGKQIEFL